MNLRRMYIFTNVAIGFLSIVPVTGQVIKEDKVCYLDDRTPACNNHLLGCIREEIAVLSAEYSSATNCTCVRRKCTSCRRTGRTVSIQSSGTCSNEYYTDDYWTFITKCSKKRVCNYPVPSQRYYNECSSMTVFSHIRYRCVDATYEINMCGGEEQIGKYVSLFYYGSSSSNASQSCMCRVMGSDSQPTDTYTITALDIRMGDVGDQKVPQLVLSSTDNVPTVIELQTNIRPYTLLLTTRLPSEVKLDIKSNHTPERIWILIEGQGDVRAKCETVNTVPITEQGKRISGIPETSGAVIGGVTVGCLVLVGLILLVVFFCRRKASVQTETSTNYEDEAMMKSKAEHEYSVIELNTAKDNVPQDITTINQPGKLIIKPIPACSECASNEERYVDVDMVTGERGGPTGKECGDVQTRKDRQEDDYNCLVTSNSGQRLVEAHYDTTASASKIVQELESQENYYSYDHLGTSAKPAVTANEYDTTFLSNSQSDLSIEIS